MKLFIAAVSTLVAGSQALVARGNTCSFTLTASGGEVSGLLSQLSDGQNRVGSSDLPVAHYTIDSNGGITDQAGRGCILTPPTTQFQCDVGATPTSGFSIGCDGTLYYEGSSAFVECETGSDGENVYSSAGHGQTGCTSITLKASGCYQPCPPPPPPPPPPAPAPTCHMLGSNFQFPHLIVPISKSNPSKAYGTSFDGQVSSDLSTIFNFDVPASYAGQWCQLEFLFPTQSQLQTSSYTFSGDGEVEIDVLSGVATTSTTYSSAPKGSGAEYTIAPGKDVFLPAFACPAGKTISVEISNAGSTDLWYFQDYNPCPIGLYMEAYAQKSQTN